MMEGLQDFWEAAVAGELENREIIGVSHEQSNSINRKCGLRMAKRRDRRMEGDSRNDQ